jgi:cytoskeletal protein CcmA (bactofilin family)
MTMNSGGDASRSNSAGRQSLIDADSRFVGTYTTPNDLRIEGQYEGTIECAGLVLVAESADVNAQLTAGSVSVQGRLRGDIGCRGRFEIQATGQVEAKVVATAIVVHDGARFEGEMHMHAPDQTVESTAAAAVSTDPRPPRRSGATESGGVSRFAPEPPKPNGRGATSEGQAVADPGTSDPLRPAAPPE